MSSVRSGTLSVPLWSHGILILAMGKVSCMSVTMGTEIARYSLTFDFLERLRWQLYGCLDQLRKSLHVANTDAPPAAELRTLQSPNNLHSKVVNDRVLFKRLVRPAPDSEGSPPLNVNQFHNAMLCSRRHRWVNHHSAKALNQLVRR